MAHANRFGKVGLLRKEQIRPTIIGFQVTFKNIQCCTECLTSKHQEKVEKITKSHKTKEFTTKHGDCAKTSNICFYSREPRKCSSSTITTTNNFSKFVITFLNRQPQHHWRSKYIRRFTKRCYSTSL